MRFPLLAWTALLGAAPAVAQDPLAPVEETPGPEVAVPPHADQAPPPAVLRIPRNWRDVFLAIRSRDWAAAQAGIAALPPHILTPVARAELYTAKGSPTVSLQQILALLAEAPELPQADQLARMAMTRGATEAPRVMPRNPIIMLGSSPRRGRARAVSGDLAADQLRALLDPLIKDNFAAEAEALLQQHLPLLTPEARAEASQRVAWAYYVVHRDADARRVAEAGKVGATGEWATHSAWIAGLASWRQGDCEAASRAFREVAGTARELELRSGGYYWAARAEQACRRPASVAPLMRGAAASPESFYGLIARETLGMDTHLPPDPHSFAAQVEHLPNVRRSVELVAIGERGLGEEMLRHQARIGRASEHHGLVEFAKRLDLAGAQFWLGHFGQRGAVTDISDRYPAPRWTPPRGWRIDPALAFAHARQESNFRADAVSQAGAVGLMQVRPGTAQDISRWTGMPYSRGSLVDPVTNLDFGQAFIERIRSLRATSGQLPRVIAAYNAGPLPVERWLSLYDKGDPLLWIESITYWETRYYVPAVLRNLWVYQGLAGAQMPTLRAMAQHRWPSFPSGQTNLAASDVPDTEAAP